MNEKIRRLMEQRGRALTNARELLNKADAESRQMTAEEQKQYDGYDAEIDRLNADIKREERLAEREAEAARSANGGRNPAMNIQPGSHEERDDDRTNTAEYRDAMLRYMAFGNTEGGTFDRFGVRESRTIGGINLSEGNGTAGGILAPTKLEKSLLEYVTEATFMRQICTVKSSESDIDLPFASSHVQASYIAEGGAFTPSDPTFDKKSFKAYKMGAMTKVTNEAMQDVFVDVAGWLNDEFGIAMATLEEQKYLVGNGNGCPTGVLDATNGAGLGVTAASATAITADEMFDLVHSVDSKYRQRNKNCAFIMNDMTLKAIRKLKASGTGDYLLQPGIRYGEPDTILGYRMYTSSSIDTMAATKTVMAFGDFKKYVIMDRRGLYIQRLNELFAGNGQVGFLAYRRNDGKLTDTAAIKKLVMANA